MDATIHAMPDRLVLATVAGFLLVVGTMAAVWYLRRRAATSIDDPSILTSAPPEGMTASVAAHFSGAPLRVSFLAALLDLASRGEICFVEEGVSGGAALVGIDIGGIDPSDPRIERNRRQPAGEADAWLLGQLELAAGNPRHAPWDSDALSNTNFPLLIGAAQSMVGAVAGELEQSPQDQATTAAVEAREKGLLSAGPNPGAVESAYEARTGHAMPAAAKEALSVLSEPVTTDDHSTPTRLHITARDARLLSTPMLFGTFLDTYERRHGWLGSLPLLTRLRWRIAGLVAAGAGIAIMSIGVDAFSDPQTGFGVGLFFGGLVVFWRAPVMVQPSVAGGLIRAQLAAYRRSLQMGFASAASIGDVIGPTGLPWLTTPDQAIAWSVAVGLGQDVGAVLARSASAPDGSADDQPAWFHPGRRRKSAADSAGRAKSDASPAQMFAGIEAIGAVTEQTPRWLRPIRSWWT